MLIKWDTLYLFEHAEEHDAAVVAEGGRLVRVDGEAVRPQRPRLARGRRLHRDHGLQRAAVIHVRGRAQDLNRDR